jgi:HK97 family phage prohead protease
MKIEFVAVPVTLDAAAGEDSPRTITGVAVPWDTPAVVSSGEKVQFARGAFDVNAKAPKLLEGHDMTQLRGVVTELVEAEEGLLFTAKFANTRASDEAIELVKAGAYDSVSVGAMPVKYKFDKNGTMVVSKANLIEISLVAQPAFADAVITEIAASQPDEESEEEVVEPQPLDIPEEETMSEVTPTVEASAETVPTAPIFAAAKREFRLPSAGEYIGAFIRGGSEFAQLNENIRAAAPNVVTDDLPGVLPIPVVSSVYNNFRGLRPVIDSLGARALPASGKVFIRPVVTTHTTIGSVTQGSTIDDGTFVIDDVQFTKEIFGGFVNVSEASIDWSSPEVVTAMLDDMARIYANQTDDYAAGILEAGVTNTNNFTAANITDPVDWVTWFYTAASDILVASNGNLPSTVWMAPNRWASAGQLSDTADRPLFPQVGPMNAFGTGAGVSETMLNMFGCRVVVDRNLTSGTLILGDPTGMEYYEQQKGAISIDSPSTLSRTVAFRGYASAKVIDDTKFIKAAFV